MSDGNFRLILFLDLFLSLELSLLLGEVGASLLLLGRGVSAAAALCAVAAARGRSAVLFGSDPGAEQMPQGTSDTYRRPASCYDTYHKRKSELLDGGNAEDVQSQDHKEGGQGSKDTSGKGLADTGVDDFFQ